MTDLTIPEGPFPGLNDKVIVVTGGSSGIGLATVKLLLASGAKVVLGDQTPPPSELDSTAVTFVKVDVTCWKDLVGLFKTAKEKYGVIDHVFANAGISGKTHYLDDETDENGDLLEPNHLNININLIAVINTVKLGIHHMKKQESGGSIVMTASASSFLRFGSVDYSIAKHGVLGLLRSLSTHLNNQQTPTLTPPIPIRLNAIAPSWTETGIVPRAIVESLGGPVQSAHVVARSVAWLMDPGQRGRHGQVVYSVAGRYREIEEGMVEGNERLIAMEGGEGGVGEGEVYWRIVEVINRGRRGKEIVGEY